ncbi:STAS domain-containing protein [Opitutus sp. ER46]|uniref:STAS domain-containing protein n=1 Tax=Opitutus sp. ER46 TaxID=2161864 RepID=UPI001304D6A6|nr:STAS domain-containing protein [Opitutus sp. ER46]
MSAIQAPTAVPSSGDVPTPRLAAGAALTIYTVEAFGAACRIELQRHPALVIDLGAVTQCDTLGVQVLCAAMRSAWARGRLLRLAEPSPAVRRAAAAVACERILFSEGQS